MLQQPIFVKSIKELIHLILIIFVMRTLKLKFCQILRTEGP